MSVEPAEQNGLFEGGYVTKFVTKTLPEAVSVGWVIQGLWYAWQDSNLRPFAPEANALSI
jgi:hypothetical protein